MQKGEATSWGFFDPESVDISDSGYTWGLNSREEAIEEGSVQSYDTYSICQFRHPELMNPVDEDWLIDTIRDLVIGCDYLTGWPLDCHLPIERLAEAMNKSFHEIMAERPHRLGEVIKDTIEGPFKGDKDVE